MKIDSERTKVIRTFQNVPIPSRFAFYWDGKIVFHIQTKFCKPRYPFISLNRKEQKFALGKEEDEAFEHLLNAIAQPPVLRMVSCDKLSFLHTDSMKKRQYMK